MSSRNANPTLDDVLAEYANASDGFDAKLLQDLVDRYPGFAPALHRYAQLQLASARATAGEIAAEELPESGMQASRSRLWSRMEIQGRRRGGFRPPPHRPQAHDLAYHAVPDPPASRSTTRATAARPASR
jgi:hypothetical protein